MKVFLSHAISDKDLIRKLKLKCKKCGLNLLVAEHFISVEQNITSKIESLIKESQISLFLLTENGGKSDFVKQEIGYVKALNKPALYMVEKGQKITGFAYGNDYIEFTPANPSGAINTAINKLLAHWKKIQEIEKQEQLTAAGILIAGIIGLAWLSDSK